MNQEVQKLSKEEQANALRQVYLFLSEFNGVPGKLATQWGKALDTVAVVVNNLMEETVEEAKHQ